MKGKTKIILTDVNTGEQEVHEDANLITEALDKIINIEMSMNHTPNTQILPIATKALGGIMLFDMLLEEDPSNIHFPADAHLVGYAGQSAGTDDAFGGSYNVIESGKTNTGFVSVWDFDTSQANGTIRSVARTSALAGEAPLYNFLAESRTTTGAGVPTTDTGWTPIRYDGEYLYMLKGNSTTHIMRLARVKIPTLRMGVGDYSDVERSYEIIATWDTEVTSWSYSSYEDMRNPYEVTTYADDPIMYEDGGDGYFYCVFYGVNARYTTYNYDITYFTVNYGDGSYDKSSSYRITTGTSFYSSRISNSMYCAGREFGHVRRGILYRMRNNRKIIDLIPLNNPASYRSTRILPDDVSDYIAHMHYMCGHNGLVYFDVYHYTESSSNYLHGVLYSDGVYVLPDKSRNAYTRHGSTVYTECRTCDDDLTVWGYYGDTRVSKNWMGNYLGTVNNLSSPITKTAAQTMKIIYTLTDVNDEEEDDG